MLTPTFYRYWFNGRAIAAVLQTDTGFVVGITGHNPEDTYDKEFGKLMAVRKLNSDNAFEFSYETAKEVGGVFAAICECVRELRSIQRDAHSDRIPYDGIVRIISGSKDIPAWLVYEMLRHEGPYTRCDGDFYTEFHKVIQKGGGMDRGRVFAEGEQIHLEFTSEEWRRLVTLFKMHKESDRALKKLVLDLDKRLEGVGPVNSTTLQLPAGFLGECYE